MLFIFSNQILENGAYGCLKLLEIWLQSVTVDAAA